MDVTRYLDLKIAPRAVFDTLAERADRVRFHVPLAAGGWRPVTWGGFAEEIRRASLFLASAGLASGDRAAIFAPNRVEWISAALAIQAAGGVMVPVYPASTAEQAAFVVKHADTRVIFVDGAAPFARVLEAWGEYAAVEKIVLLDDSLDILRVAADLQKAGKTVPPLGEVEAKIVRWSQAQSIGAARDAADPAAFERTMAAISLDQIGLMLYTSGTSGNPKGVPLTHRNVAVNGLDWLKNNATLIDENAVDLLWLPMSHIFGFGEACLGNTLGFTTYLCDPMSALAKLGEVRPTVFMSVPSLWEKLAMTALAERDPSKRRTALENATGGRMRFCLSGGAGLKREVKELFHECGLLIIEGYGLTETSPTLTLNSPGAFRFDTVGKPLPSVQIMLAEDGEILAKGPNVFGGYHKDPVATREAFTEDGWFKTGDIGRFTEDGFLQIIDRKKDILVTAGGKNVAPANIELRFRDDPFVQQVIVYGDGKRFLVAGVWLNDLAVDAEVAAPVAAAAASAREEAIRALVQKRIDRANSELASYETIKKFCVLPGPLAIGELMTPTLKIKRKKVYETFRDRFEALYS